MSSLSLEPGLNFVNHVQNEVSTLTLKDVLDEWIIFFFLKVKCKNLYRTQHNMEKLRQIFS